jgi:hypothetical protein
MAPCNVRNTRNTHTQHNTQEAARLMAAGEYEAALPVALDAVQQGQALFKPAPALQLFPLYLLAAQANLGLRRAKQVCVWVRWWQWGEGAAVCPAAEADSS